MERGHLSLILHAHLPYVRHPEYDDFLEEDWLFEAITETYIPLLHLLEQQLSAGHRPRLAMSLTPPLCHMLRDQLLQQRYVRYIERLILLAESECDRNHSDPERLPLSRMYLERYQLCRRLYLERWQMDLVAGFAALQEAGILEIMTCGASHGFLPLLADSEAAVRAQILIARDDYQHHFGQPPRGIWLPECAYYPGLDAILSEAELRWFIVDSHGLMFAAQRPRHAIYQPVFTPSGPAAFARDRDSSCQVWSAEHGYPGDPAYRDFYRDIGFDLSRNYLLKFFPENSDRRFTGMKYHRVTGQGQDKQIYNPSWAAAAVDSHARHFMESRAEQITRLSTAMSTPPIVVSPFDAELFGHWWFEGPEFLDLLLRKSLYDQNAYRLVTPGDHLQQFPLQQCIEPSASSWGNMGYWEVWLDDSNSWIYKHLHSAANRMHQAANNYKTTSDPLIERYLAQLARELLLAQSSDWAFLMRTGTAHDYAKQRTHDHINRFNRLYQQLATKVYDETFLKDCEWRDNLFPHLNWRHYC